MPNHFLLDCQGIPSSVDDLLLRNGSKLLKALNTMFAGQRAGTVFLHICYQASALSGGRCVVITGD